MDDELETFETYADPDSISPTTEYEGTNAARFALMASLGADLQHVASAGPTESLSRSLAAFGLNQDLVFSFQESSSGENTIREVRYLISTFSDRWDPTDARYRAFESLNEGVQLDARLTLLAAGLASTLERESVTAASAILTSASRPGPPVAATGWRGWPNRFLDRRIDSLRFGGAVTDLSASPDQDGAPAETIPWDGAAWENYSTYWLGDVMSHKEPNAVLAALRFLAQVRVDVAQRSSDPIVRELGLSSFLNLPDHGASVAAVEGREESRLITNRLSTMVHGTWGWKGSWWYPWGNFHSYIGEDERPGLYAGGQEFSWSGAYSDSQRVTGGNRFRRWVEAAGGTAGLETVFAHSYGGEVVARAVNSGAVVDEVVLMSAPINSHHRQMLDRVRRVIDIRLEFDIVLTAARATQRLPAAQNVTEHVIKKRFWSHGATHHPTVWIEEGIAASVRL